MLEAGNMAALHHRLGKRRAIIVWPGPGKIKSRRRRSSSSCRKTRSDCRIRSKCMEEGCKPKRTVRARTLKHAVWSCCFCHLLLPCCPVHQVVLLLLAHQLLSWAMLPPT